jgi:TPR repeat protein
MPVEVGTVSTAVRLALAASRGLPGVLGVQPEYGPFWKAFAARAKPRSADVPWTLIHGWRLDPDFIGAACRLMRGERAALDELRAGHFASAARSRPPGSHLSAEEVVDELEQWAWEAAALALKGFPELFHLSQSRRLEGLVTGETDRVMRELADLADRLTGDRRPGRPRVSSARWLEPPARLGELAVPDGFYTLGVEMEAQHTMRDAGLRDRAPYIWRDVDENLREKLSEVGARGSCSLIVLNGPPRAGKSRTLLEAAAAVLPGAWLLAPADSAGLAALAQRKPPGGIGPGPCVIWLDDRYRVVRPGIEGFGSDTIAALAKWKRPVVVLTTDCGLDPMLWAGAITDSAVRVIRFELPAQPSASEKQRLVDAGYSAESRRSIASVGIGAYLTDARRLVERLDKSLDSPAGVAATRAAIDWKASGMPRPISADCLQRLSQNYLGRPLTPAEFEAGVQWATSSDGSGRALLSGADTYDVDNYVAHECGVRHPLEPATWDAIIDEYAEEEELATQVGRVAIRLGDLDRAERAYRRAADGGHPVGALNLGVLLEQRGELRQAEAAYRHADVLGDPNGANNLGVLLLRRAEINSAESAFRRADKGGSAHGAANLGDVLESRGDLRGAERAYRRADERGSMEGANSLGFLLAHFRGDLHGAETAYGHADERGSAKGAWHLGMLLEHRGDLDGAEAAFRRAFERGDGDAGYSLARVLELRGAN